jgi:cellulose synthase/poly-beta-1,6-N-acetylglucosamine synthase-like glycosyltransferase
MGDLSGSLALFLPGLFIACQVLYSLAFLIDLYFSLLPVDTVDVAEADGLQREDFPYIVLFYPVLKELEATMRTTFVSLTDLRYPKDRYRVVAIPNASDIETVASLSRLQHDFSFLQIVVVPPTTASSWQVVWDAWDRTEKAYWWHQGRRARNRDLPPKKTRQLIYAFYNIAAELKGKEDFLVNYIDADSCPPRDHFLAAAVGMRRYDVLQAQNIAGNLNASMAASWHAFDHMAWDGMKYPHLSANGRHPYWVLGKGLFFRASDLVALGGFHPWITIEDPEVGMRFWVNGKRLGIIETPLIEEVPSTIMHGITQRKRWVCGFFQSLGQPLSLMGMTRWQRVRARMNFLPCLSLSINAVGIPTGVWALWVWMDGTSIVPAWTIWLAGCNLSALTLSLAALYWTTWKRTALVLRRRRDRAWYMLRVNPVSLMVWWLLWLVPLWIGFRMYRRDQGLAWERTEKSDANHALIRSQKLARAIEFPPAAGLPESQPLPAYPQVVGGNIVPLRSSS